MFSTLSLDGEDEDDGNDNDNEESSIVDPGPEIVQQGLGPFVSMLDRSQPSVTADGTSTSAAARNDSEAVVDKTKRRRRRKGDSGAEKYASHGIGTSSTSGKVKSRPMAARYANVCMYAELLELRDDDIQQWDRMSAIDVDGMVEGGIGNEKERISGALPNDLENGWVALAPIPAGKRCLAVSYQHQVGSVGPAIGACACPMFAILLHFNL